MSIDYKALVADRKQKQTRPIVREPICLVPELHADLEEAQDALTSLTDEDRRSDDDDDPDPRAGGMSPRGALIAQARAEVSAAQEKIDEVTVTGVFKAPTSDRQGELQDQLDKLIEANPENSNKITVQNAKTRILECFERFEDRDRQPIDTLSRDDLSVLLDTMAQGEVLSIHVKIVRAATRDHSLPFSVRRSLAAQRSAVTSS